MNGSGKIRSKRLKKLVHWHDNYVIFVTPEAKTLKWGENTFVKVSIENSKIIIEKAMEL
jgi:hypothetical protein